MKTLFATLAFLLTPLALPCFGQTVRSTTGDIHAACASSDRSPFMDGLTLGYIAGAYAALPDVSAPSVTRGDMRDAVCRYIDLHPELWSESDIDGVTHVLKALYRRRSR